MIMLKRTIGDKGEDFTVKYLRKNHYKILERNYSGKFGEIDIICANREYICFVEVKTRAANSFGRPAEYVSIHKQRRIIRTAYHYLANNKVSNKMYRFDIAEVTYDDKGVFSINYIENAFMVENY